MADNDIETEIERIARRLCAAYGVHPGDTIPSDTEPKFKAYSGDTYMQWARDQVEIFMAIFSANLDRS